MGDAPELVSHTPVIYVKGGGSAMFSARCRQLLIDAGLNPDDFGSFNQQRDRIQQARTRVDAWDKAEKEGRSTDGLTPPTPEDRALLNRVNASHLVSTNAHLKDRVPGQERPRRLAKEEPTNKLSPANVVHDPCRNEVDGFVDGEAPAMLLPNDIETRVSGDETRQARDQAAPNAVAPYPGDARRGHENERADRIVNELHQQNGGTMSPTQLGTGTPGAGNTAAAQIAERDPTAAADPSKPAKPSDNEVNGESAAECVKNFIRMKEAEMKTDGVDREIDRLRAQAANAPQVAPVREAHRNAQAAKTTAETNRANAQTARDEAHAEVMRERGRPTDEAHRQRQVAAQERLDRADTALATRNTELNTANANARTAEQDLQRAEFQFGAADQANAHADCLEQQRARIQAGSGNDTGIARARAN